MRALRLLLATSAASWLSIAQADAAYNPSSFIAPGTANSTVPYPVLSYVTPQMFGAKCDGSTDDSTALQTAETKAAAIHAEIHYPGGQCNFATTITPGVGVIHRGVGMGQTILNYTGTTHAFYLQNPNGVNLIQAPQFFDFTMQADFLTGTTNAAIQLNSIAGGFTDDASTQDYMFQPIVQRVLFNGPGAAGIAFQCSKCFNLFFANNNVQNYATAVDVEGSDVASISDNALYNAATQEILAQSHGTFGSELKVSHNDMPGMQNGATSFINIGYRSEWIEYNHLEQDIPSISSMIDLDCSAADVTIDNNNIIATTSNTSAWLTEVGTCVQLSAFNNNEQAGPSPPSAIFNSGNGMLYYYNVFYQSVVTSGGNLNQNSGFPFNSVPQNTVTPVAYIPASGQTIWQFNPNLPGMTNSDAGTTIYVKNDAFVIPPSASGAVSQVDFQGPSELPSSGWDMWVCGYAGTSGQTIDALDGSTSPTQALTTTNTCYELFTNDTHQPGTLSIKNADTSTNSNAFITQVIVRVH